jgi:hypothetical protein
MTPLRIIVDSTVRSRYLLVRNLAEIQKLSHLCVYHHEVATAARIGRLFASSAIGKAQGGFFADSCRSGARSLSHCDNDNGGRWVCAAAAATRYQHFHRRDCIVGLVVVIEWGWNFIQCTFASSHAIVSLGQSPKPSLSTDNNGSSRGGRYGTSGCSPSDPIYY